MRVEFEEQDLHLLAAELVALLKPHLAPREAEQRDELFDVKGVSRYLHTSTQWVYKRTQMHEIPHYKVDGKLLFRKSEIDRWLLKGRVPEIAAPGDTRRPRLIR